MERYNILIWGHGRKYNDSINMIKYQEQIGTIKVLGIIDKKEIYTRLDGYPILRLSNINKVKFDYVLVTSDDFFDEICETAVSLGIERNKIVPVRVFLLPRFDFRKYVDLMKSQVSIIANLCWGGVTYHTLGMEFLSPFINLYLKEEDYLKLLSNIKYYINCKLKFIRWEYNKSYKRDFPVCALDDVELYFNHYFSFDEAEKSWHNRCLKINWKNLFVMMYTENKDVLERFDRLKFDKKICFVPFKSNLKSSYSIIFSSSKEVEKKEWWEIVNGLATSLYYSYDILDLLLEGKPNYTRIL